jgi:hypothetical protein
LTRRLVVVALACLSLPAGARADADPASDFLIVRNVFLPYVSDIDQDAVDQLETTLRDAGERGFKIKVAVIAQPADLGGVFQLYQQPQRYAEFLGKELILVHRGGRILIAMPNGFGYSERGEPNRRLARALAGLPPPGRDPTKLVQSAATAVRRLAAAEGHKLPPPRPTGDGSATRDRIVIGVAALVSALFLFGGIALVRRLRATGRGTA